MAVDISKIALAQGNYTPLSYDDMARPIRNEVIGTYMQNEAYTNWEQETSSMGLSQEDYDTYLKPTMDKVREASNSLIKNGLDNAGGINNFLQLRKEYIKNVTPVKIGQSARNANIIAQQQAKLKAPNPNDIIFKRKASDIPLSEWIDNPTLDTVSNAVNLSVVRADSNEAMSNIAKQMYPNGVTYSPIITEDGNVLPGYYDVTTRYGISSEELTTILEGGTPYTEAGHQYLQAIDTVLNKYKVTVDDGWSEEDVEAFRNSILSQSFKAVGNTTSSTMKDDIYLYELQERQAQRQRTLDSRRRMYESALQGYAPDSQGVPRNMGGYTPEQQACIDAGQPIPTEQTDEYIAEHGYTGMRHPDYSSGYRNNRRSTGTTNTSNSNTTAGTATTTNNSQSTASQSGNNNNTSSGNTTTNSSNGNNNDTTSSQNNNNSNVASNNNNNSSNRNNHNSSNGNNNNSHNSNNTPNNNNTTASANNVSSNQNGPITPNNKGGYTIDNSKPVTNPKKAMEDVFRMLSSERSRTLGRYKNIPIQKRINNTLSNLSITAKNEEGTVENIPVSISPMSTVIVDNKAEDKKTLMTKYHLNTNTERGLNTINALFDVGKTFKINSFETFYKKVPKIREFETEYKYQPKQKESMYKRYYNMLLDKLDNIGVSDAISYINICREGYADTMTTGIVRINLKAEARNRLIQDVVDGINDRKGIVYKLVVSENDSKLAMVTAKDKVDADSFIKNSKAYSFAFKLMDADGSKPYIMVTTKNGEDRFFVPLLGFESNLEAINEKTSEYTEDRERAVQANDRYLVAQLDADALIARTTVIIQMLANKYK